MIKNIFKWIEAHRKPPTRKDVLNALKLQYVMRINITKKIIEHAQISSQNEDDALEPKQIRHDEGPNEELDKMKQH